MVFSHLTGHENLTKKRECSSPPWAEWAEGAVHGAELSATRRVIGGGLSLVPSYYWAQVPFQKQQSEDLDYESLVNT